MGAKHAKWFVTSARTTGWLRETELVPKTQGVVEAIKQTRFALDLARHGKVPPPFPPHTAKDVGESKQLYKLVRDSGPRRVRRDRPGRARAREGSTHGIAREASVIRTPTAARLPKPFIAEQKQDACQAKGRVLQGLSRVALGEGARLLDPRARAEGRPGAGRARVGHLLRRRRHPRGRARLLPPPERAHPGLRGRDGRRHADDRLQRLHAQPAPGELAAAGRRRVAGARQREPRRGRRAGLRAATSTCATSSGRLSGGEGYELLKAAAHRASPV